MKRRYHDGLVVLRGAAAGGRTLALAPRLASDRCMTPAAARLVRLALAVAPALIAPITLDGSRALAQETRLTTPMPPSPEHATMCAHGCETLARVRAGSARVRVVSAQNGDALADGTTLWLVVETSRGSFARALAEDGVGCGFDRPLAIVVELESLALLDVEDGATPGIRVTFRRTVDGAGGLEALACGLDDDVPACAAVAPPAE